MGGGRKGYCCDVWGSSSLYRIGDGEGVVMDAVEGRKDVAEGESGLGCRED